MNLFRNEISKMPESVFENKMHSIENVYILK